MGFEIVGDTRLLLDPQNTLQRVEDVTMHTLCIPLQSFTTKFLNLGDARLPENKLLS
jgi:hypothetical protein